MSDFGFYRTQLDENGFCLVPSVFSAQQCDALLSVVEHSSRSIHQSDTLFAIRRFLEEIPGATALLENRLLNQLIATCASPEHFIVKSVWFDKPERSNWFVTWHQDLMIHVDRKAELPGYFSWKEKAGLVSVQPPREVLENIVTIRLHLDDCDETNGALQVLPGSHKEGIVRYSGHSFTTAPVVCRARKGDVLLMKPLLFHASSRATGNRRRRIIHLETSNLVLPSGLQWAEKITLAPFSS